MRNMTSIPLVLAGAALAARYPGPNLSCAYRFGSLLSLLATFAAIGSM